jgi:NAD(P)-dependent dehydrogenase (short-subunit alcohol dehydrogenase family)
MGLSVCKAFSETGAHIVMLDLNQDLLQEEAKRLGADFYALDVANVDQTESLFAELSENKRSLRVAVNCAGIAPAKRMVGRDAIMPLAEFSNVIEVNLIGTFNIMRQAAGLMSHNHPNQDGERGVIINTASVAAFEGQVGQTAYSASKGGVVAMTLPAARELASLGIRVNTIAPGIIGTPMLLNMPEEVQASLSKMVPFPKRMGRPEEFASLAAHIVDNAMLNGEVIRLDGAIRMQAK